MFLHIIIKNTEFLPYFPIRHASSLFKFSVCRERERENTVKKLQKYLLKTCHEFFGTTNYHFFII